MALESKIELVTSTALLTEFARVLTEKFGHTDIQARERVRRIVAVAHIAKPTITVREIEEDPDDDRVLEAALASDATVSVSGDKHLLRFGTRAPGMAIFQGFPTPPGGGSVSHPPATRGPSLSPPIRCRPEPNPCGPLDPLGGTVGATHEPAKAGRDDAQPDSFDFRILTVGWRDSPQAGPSHVACSERTAPRLPGEPFAMSKRHASSRRRACRQRAASRCSQSRWAEAE